MQFETYVFKLQSLRDTGILHALLKISDFDSLLGHPVIGASWEGFVVENIIVNLSSKWQYSYYRSSTQAEIDLVLEGPGNQIWAIEIKRSSAPKIKRGFHTACKDVGATNKFVVYSGTERFPLPEGTEAIGVTEFIKLVRQHEAS